MTLRKYAFSELDPKKWNELICNQLGHVPFYNWSCLESLEKTGNLKEITVIVAETNDNYLVALPGEEKNGMFNNLFFRTFDNLDMLVSKFALQEHITEFIQFMTNTFSAILLRNFNADSKLHQLNWSCIKEPARKCPYLDLPAESDTVFELINKSFKKTLRWNINGLTKHGVETRVITGNEMIGVYEHDFIVQHQSRMKEKKISSNFLSNEVQGYFKNLNAVPNSGAMLTVASKNGEFLGTIYGIRNNVTYAYIASGIKSNIEKFSIGQFLIFKTMEYLVQHKCKRFDFLRGTESYKSHWTKNSTINDTRYYYKSSGRLAAFKLFYRNNKNRYGRAKCLRILLGAMFQSNPA